MSCRDTFGNSAVTSIALFTGKADEKGVQKLFHAVRREGVKVEAADPTAEEVTQFLERQHFNVRHDERLKDRRASILKRLDSALDQARRGEKLPDGAMFHAWRHVQADCANAELVKSVQSREDTGTWTPGARPTRNSWDRARDAARRGVAPGEHGRVFVRDLQAGDTLSGSKPGTTLVVERTAPTASGKRNVRFADGTARSWGTDTPVSISRPADPQAALDTARARAAVAHAEHERVQSLPTVDDPAALTDGDVVHLPGTDGPVRVAGPAVRNALGWKIPVRPDSGRMRRVQVYDRPANPIRREPAGT